MEPGLSTWITLIIAAGLGVAYAIRVTLRGPVHFERVSQQGGGLLLVIGYWGIQPIARFFIYLGLSPNWISLLALALGLLSGVSLALGNFAAGGFLITVSGALDALDGLVARKTDQVTPEGKVLDSTLDRYVEFFFLGGLLFYYQSQPYLQLLVFLAAFGSFMVSYSTAIGEIFRLQLPGGRMRRPQRMFFFALGAILSPGLPMILALGIVGTLSNLSALERFVAIRRLIRERETSVLPLKKSA